VTIKKRPMNADGKTVERRKSRRFPVAVPVEVSWRDKNGVAMKAEAVARQVNANGGFLKMSSYPELGSRITLANFLSAQTTEARVLAAPSTREGVADGVIVEIIEPNETFWGVNLQVEKTTAELQKLEKAMQNEGIDLRLLKEYRDAVDFIRSAARVVQQLRDCQLRGLDDAELFAILTNQRIRRTIDSCLEVTTDLEAGRVTSESKDVDELYQALEQLSSRLRRDCQKQGDRLLSDSRTRKVAPAPRMVRTR
jgi:ribosome-associated translation inhibitor RaiA